MTWRGPLAAQRRGRGFLRSSLAAGNVQATTKLGVLGELLAPPPEDDRVHGVAPFALVGALVGAHADRAEAPVKDLGAVVATVHPASEHVVGLGVLAGSSADILPVDAPVVAVALESTANIAMSEVVLLNHACRVRTGRLGELRTHAQRPQLPALAFVVVQAKGAFLLPLELYRPATAGLDGLGRRPRPLWLDSRDQEGSTSGQEHGSKNDRSVPNNCGEPPPLLAQSTLAQLTA
jgi:hypothetical protein